MKHSYYELTTRARAHDPHPADEGEKAGTHMFAELVVIGVLHLTRMALSTWTEPEGRKEGRRTLWKSYLFSCRTKDAKFECLNMRGRMDFVNSFMSLTTKQSPCGPHETTGWNAGSSSILHRRHVSSHQRKARAERKAYL